MGCLALTVTALAAWNVSIGSKNNDRMSDVMLANVEALAQTESNSGFSGYCKDEVNSCMFVCPGSGCGAVSIVTGKKGPSYDVKGKCTKCGYSIN